MLTFINNFRKNNKAATAVEYGLIAALISIASIAAMTTLGKRIGTTFSTVSKTVANVTVPKKK